MGGDNKGPREKEKRRKTQTNTSYFQAFLNKILLSFFVLEYTVAKLSVIYFDLNFFYIGI